MLETVWQDVRYGFRSLKRAPGFAVVAIGSLAVGVGFAVFIFSFVQQAIGFTTVPAAGSGRLVDVFTNQLNGTAYGTSSFPDIESIRTRTAAFDGVAAYSPYAAALNVDGTTRTGFGELVTGNYFELLGVSISLGRPLIAADDTPGAPRVIVLSDGLWRRRFGSSASAIGRVVRIRNQPYTVVGVAAPRYRGAAFVPVDFWTAMTWAEDAEPVGISDTMPGATGTRLEQRGTRWLFAKGRLAGLHTVESARTALQSLMTQLAAEYPTTNAKRRFSALDTRSVRIHPAFDSAVASVSAALGVVVLLVLVVVCANVSGLMLARGTSRRREVAIRFAVGASRRRVLRQLITESVLVSAIGSAAAIAVLWILTVIGRDLAVRADTPFTIEPRLGTPAVWFGVALAIAVGIAAGLMPALRATDGGRLVTLSSTTSLGATARRRWTLRDGLIVIQMAAAFVLLVTAGLLARSTMASQHVDLGFRTKGIVSISAGTAVLGYDASKAAQFYEQALIRIRTLPEVESAALAGRKPLDISYSSDTFFPSDRPAASATGEIAYTARVSPEYFGLFDIRIVEGRNFGPADTRSSPSVAIVTRAFARKFWPGEPVVGKHFHAQAPTGRDVEIVGVSDDYAVARPGEAPTPYIHYLVAQDQSTEWQILVRGRAGTMPPLVRIRRELAALEPGLLFESASMTSNVTRVLLPLEAAAAGLSVVGVVTILFAAIGLYAVISFMVARRAQEFGVRMAIGASPRQVLSFVISHGIVVGAVGIAIGALAAGAGARVLSRTLYGVSAVDPLTWTAALIIVFGISLVAHAIPARRAASINPAIALRAE
ncbi:MAG TPA: ADOP family duplicated permease [Vicinamibacterales bacterium]